MTDQNGRERFNISGMNFDGNGIGGLDRASNQQTGDYCGFDGSARKASHSKVGITDGTCQEPIAGAGCRVEGSKQGTPAQGGTARSMKLSGNSKNGRRRSRV